VRTLLFRILLSLAAAGILVLLFYRLGPENILLLFRQMSWKFFGVVLIFGAAEIMRALALRHCLTGESRPAFRKLLYIRVLSEGVRAVTLTGPFLSEPTRAWLIRRQGVPSSEAVAATVAEYAANSLMSATLTVACVLYLLNYVAIPKELRIAAIVLMCGSAGMLITGIVVLYRRTYLAGAIAAALVRLLGLQSRAAGKLAGIRRMEDALLVLRDRPTTLLRITALEFVAQVLMLVETYWALVSMGVMVSLLTASITEILSKLANVAFAGAAEGAYVLLFHALGLPVAAGFALSLVKRMRSLAYALIGLGILAVVPDHAQTI
jgi:glycosyltransferase 2 family protein